MSIRPSASLTIQTPKGIRKIGPGEPAFIVAEMSGNHNLNFDKAVEIIKAVAKTGADAIKIQTYTPDTMTIDSDKEWFRFNGKENPELWNGKTLYQLYQKAYTPWEWQAELKKITEAEGLTFFSTPFDPTAVDFLEKLDVPCYKIASYEATDITLLEKVAATKKPVIISVGFATSEEVEQAVQALRNAGCSELALLHCLTDYAKAPGKHSSNLRTMSDISERFGVVAGFSDNNGGIAVPFLAALYGASIIEKHVIMDRAEGGPDSDFSITTAELSELVKNIRDAEYALGTVHYGPQSSAEEYNKLHFRRSLFVVKDMKAGEEFTPENTRVIRPEYGLPPKHYKDVIGKHATCDIERGTPLAFNLIV